MQRRARPQGRQEARQQTGMGHMDQRPQNWQFRHGLAYSQSDSEQFGMPKATSFPNRIFHGDVLGNLPSFLLLLFWFGTLGTTSVSVSVLFWKAHTCWHGRSQVSFIEVVWVSPTWWHHIHWSFILSLKHCQLIDCMGGIGYRGNKTATVF